MENIFAPNGTLDADGLRFYTSSHNGDVALFSVCKVDDAGDASLPFATVSVTLKKTDGNWVSAGRLLAALEQHKEDQRRLAEARI